MMGAALAQGDMPLRVPLIFEDERQIAAEREDYFRLLANLREQVGDDTPRDGNITDEERFLLGLSIHECCHVAVSLVVGDSVLRVRLVPSRLTGAAWALVREKETASAIVARIAVLEAGHLGWSKATGDMSAAYVTASHDRAMIEELLTRNGLTSDAESDARETALRLGREVAEIVLADRECWDSIVTLSFRLIDERCLDGDEIQRRVCISDELRARVAHLVW